MSFTAAHESKDVRRACQSCQERKARFSYGGRIRADRDHTLCFECYRAERDRGRARRLVDGSGTRPLYLPGDFRGRPLTDREVAHRQQMLAHLASRARSL